MINIPDFLAFIANNTIIGVLALLGWILVVAAVVWLLEKAVEKFLGRIAARAKTPAPSSEATNAQNTRERHHTGRPRTRSHSPGSLEGTWTCSTTRFCGLAVALATPFVVPRMWGQKTLVGALTVGAALIAASDFMQAADAQQFQRPLPNDPERFRMIEDCVERSFGRPGGNEHMLCFIAQGS